MHSHTSKQIADWFSGLAVACACFICEFEPSKAMDETTKLHDDNIEKLVAKKVNTNQSNCIKEFFIKNDDHLLSHFPLGTYGSCSGILNPYARGNFHRIFKGRITPERYPTQSPMFKKCSEYIGLLYRGMSLLFVVIAFIGCALSSHQCVSMEKRISSFWKDSHKTQNIALSWESEKLSFRFSCIAVEKDNYIEVGVRPTASAVFVDSARIVGKMALTKVNEYPGRTAYSVKQLIGRQFNGPEVVKLSKLAEFTIVNVGGEPSIREGR